MAAVPGAHTALVWERGEKRSTMVVAANCAPAKGGDAGGGFGVKTRSAKPLVWGQGRFEQTVWC